MMLLTLLLSSLLTLVELNCENLFDCRHDAGKQDQEFTPEGARHWTSRRYWDKLNNIGRAVLGAADELPDVVALCEVENDSVMRDLTRRSLLRNAGYEYLMTQSPDVRGIDVALLYQPSRFRPLCYDYIEVAPLKGMRPTRDILYVRGQTPQLDTLHLFLLHAPSRFGGEKASRPNRLQVAHTLMTVLPNTERHYIVVTGDFNDDADSQALQELEQAGLCNISKDARGRFGHALGTYRFRGLWQSIDHVLVSAPLKEKVGQVYVNDAPFLLEDDEQYGGKKPRRCFNGFRYQKGGFSDHLALVVHLQMSKTK